MADTASTGSFPCLNSNNCTEWASNKLSTQHRKAAAALIWNIVAMVKKWGIERIGFLTLTFRDHVLDAKEAQRRFHSLRTHVLSKRYPAFIRVFERQKSGRIHYHLLVVCSDDIRTGIDFEAVMRCDYRSAGEILRSEWAFWRQNAKKYGFGRTELLPIKSTTDGISKYVGKYIAKHISSRKLEDKGIRLVDYSKDARIATTCFTWVSPGGVEWRRKLKLFAEMVCIARGHPVVSMKVLSLLLGPRWAYRWRDFILSLPESK